jgi:hypothetical protein
MERSLAELKVNFHCEGHYIYDCLWKVEGVFVCACACACLCLCMWLGILMCMLWRAKSVTATPY